ncbi:MAG: UDP-N-acetylmuramoyl-tripeptide--D-alanyl-D-alanine ligase [Flavobacteriaceae bacterium]|nr:UDP-N-acetylmuramoyl-tripeptide--D-alanyl-D-alanine ligase [Flavobacteriaceae bacterium]
MDIKKLHEHFLSSSTVCTDTRKITKNCIFFALKGANFDGNTFASKAINMGAKYAIIDAIEFEDGDNYILVDDVLKTLQDLASYHRKYLNTTIIALTGSNGKTTTKELINSVMRTAYNTVATVGNLNNHIGVPLTLLAMDETTEIGIVEMGANHQKEIDFLCKITQPDYGYITNFGKAHLEGFGGVEGVIKGKSELYTHLIEHDKTILVNTKDGNQITLTNSASKRILFGEDNSNSSIQIKFLKANPYVQVEFEELIISSQLIGTYNASNISAAIAFGKHLEIDTCLIKKAIENYIPNNNRSQIINKSSNKIILDAYNANPSSMTAALDHLNTLEDSNKIAILGDMFELGYAAAQEHDCIAKYAEQFNFSSVYLVGAHFSNTRASQNKRFKSFEDLKLHMAKIKFKESTILIKGSRGMALERVLDLL